MPDETKPKETSNWMMEGFFARINHPIFGAFAFSWILWNWDMVYLLIMGRADYSHTIDIVWNSYLTKEHLSRTFWGPAVSCGILLLLSPVLRDVYRTFVKWSEAYFGGYSPVPKVQYDQLKKELDALLVKNNVVNAAYNYLVNGSDPQRKLFNLTAEVETYKRQWEDAIKENALLKADRSLSANQSIALIKEENEYYKKREVIASKTLADLEDIKAKYLTPLSKALPVIAKHTPPSELPEIFFNESISQENGVIASLQNVSKPVYGNSENKKEAGI